MRKIKEGVFGRVKGRHAGIRSEVRLSACD